MKGVNTMRNKKTNATANTTAIATTNTKSNATTVNAGGKNGTRIVWANVNDKCIDSMNEWLDAWTQNYLDTADKNAEIKDAKKKLAKKIEERDKVLEARDSFKREHGDMEYTALVEELDRQFPITATNRAIAKIEKQIETDIVKKYSDKLKKSNDAMKSACESIIPDSLYPAYLNARTNGDNKAFLAACTEFARNIGLWSPNKTAMTKFANLMFTRMAGDATVGYTTVLKKDGAQFTKAKTEKAFNDLGIRVIAELLVARSVGFAYDEKTARPCFVHRDFTLSLEQQAKYAEFLESKCSDAMTKKLATLQREYVDSKRVKAEKAEKSAKTA